jgi:hypothetical protein
MCPADVEKPQPKQIQKVVTLLGVLAGGTHWAVKGKLIFLQHMFHLKAKETKKLHHHDDVI